MCVVSLREEVMKRDERASREGLSVVSVGVCVCVCRRRGGPRDN